MTDDEEFQMVLDDLATEDDMDRWLLRIILAIVTAVVAIPSGFLVWMSLR